MEEGVKVYGQVINNNRYADDTVLISISMDGLQVLLNKFVEAGLEYEVNLNIKITK